MIATQKKINTLNLYRSLNHICIAAVITLLSLLDLILRSGRSDLRMATASSDDNFIVAWLVKNKSQEFEYDKFGQLISDLQDTTPLGQLLVFILEENIIDQSSLWSAIVFLQRVLLYFAVYELSKFISKSNLTSIITVILVAGTHPYYLNLGWFGALEEQPYPMWLALPFLIFSYTKMIQSNQKISVLYAFIGICIHPSFAFLYFFVLILFSLVEFRQRKTTFYLSAASLVLAIFYIQRKSVELSVIPSDLKKLAFTNQHLDFYNPFLTDYFDNSLYIWMTLILTAILVLKHSSLVQIKELKEPYLALIAVCGSFIVFHSISLTLEISKGVAIFGPRLTVFLAIIGFVYLIAVALPLLMHNSFLIRTTAALVCLIPSPISIFLLIASQIEFKKFDCVRSLALKMYLVLFTLLNSIPKLLSIAQIPESYFSDFVRLNYTTLNFTKTLFSNYFLVAANSNMQLFVLASIILIFLVMKKTTFQIPKNTNLILFLLLVSFLLPNGINANYKYSFNGMELEQVKSYTQAQKWALENTPEDSNFFIDGATVSYSWRTLSNRPTINPNRIFSLYIYPEYIAEYNLRWQNFWKESLDTGAIEQYGEWKEPFFCESRYLMNIDYILQTKSQDELKFPVVYLNKFYRVYGVECDK